MKISLSKSVPIQKNSRSRLQSCQGVVSVTDVDHHLQQSTMTAGKAAYKRVTYPAAVFCLSLFERCSFEDLDYVEERNREVLEPQVNHPVGNSERSQRREM